MEAACEGGPPARAFLDSADVLPALRGRWRPPARQRAEEEHIEIEDGEEEEAAAGEGGTFEMGADGTGEALHLN